MEGTLIFTINVTLYDTYHLEGSETSVNMIAFSAVIDDELFRGSTVTNGFDTQLCTAESFSLSARYMLEGTDRSGSKCRIFIENNGTSTDNCHPRIFTDSKELSFLEHTKLFSVVLPSDEGVTIKIYSQGPEV